LGQQDEVTQGARALSRQGASRGGRARAERLSLEERRAIARQAALARWGSTTLSATHTGDLQIGDRRVACAVLEDGTRVVNQGTLLTALSRSRRPKSGDAGTVLFAANLRPYISPQLAQGISEPIAYLMPGGVRALGYKAEILPEVCEVYLDARKDGQLFYNQKAAADAAEILLRKRSAPAKSSSAFSRPTCRLSCVRGSRPSRMSFLGKSIASRAGNTAPAPQSEHRTWATSSTNMFTGSYRLACWMTCDAATRGQKRAIVRTSTFSF